MGEFSFRSILNRALRESREAVRLDAPVRIFVAFAAPAAVGIMTWLASGELAWSAFASVAAILLLLFLIFLSKMLTVPIAIASETESRRKETENQLGERIAALERERADQRDPDLIYQLGTYAARAVYPTVQRAHSIVHFAALQDAADLDLTREFEYREYVLELINHRPGLSVQMGNQRRDVTHHEVICRIIRLR